MAISFRSQKEFVSFLQGWAVEQGITLRMMYFLLLWQSSTPLFFDVRTSAAFSVNVTWGRKDRVLCKAAEQFPFASGKVTNTFSEEQFIKKKSHNCWFHPQSNFHQCHTHRLTPSCQSTAMWLGITNIRSVYRRLKLKFFQVRLQSSLPAALTVLLL